MTASSARVCESWVSPSASALQGAACSPTVLMPLLEYCSVRPTPPGSGHHAPLLRT